MYIRKDLEKMTAKDLKSLAYSYGITINGNRKNYIDGIDNYITMIKGPQPEKVASSDSEIWYDNVDKYMTKGKEKMSSNWYEVGARHREHNLPEEKININEPKKNVQIACASPHMKTIKLYKSCNDNKICNVNTGKCIANSNTNKKNKAMLTINGKVYVGDQEYINMLHTLVEKEFRSCDILSFISKYGYFINRMIIFLKPKMNPGKCLMIKNDLTRVESRCRTTADSIIYALTGDNFIKYNSISKNNLTLTNVLDKLHESGILVLSILSDNEFGGHIFIIIRSKNIYYIIQSYIFEYCIDVTVATDTQIIQYIRKYLDIFSNNIWNKEDTYLWKCLTGVEIPIYNNKKPDLFIYWTPTKYEVDNDQCQVHIKKLISDALEKIESIKEVPPTIVETIEYMKRLKHLYKSFGDMMKIIDNSDGHVNAVYKIADDFEKLMEKLNTMEHTIDYNHLSEDGCLQIAPSCKFS